ncbi:MULTISPECIES: hypothetical protein [unclassified Microcoleus]
MKGSARPLDLLISQFDSLPDDRLALKSLVLLGALCLLMRRRSARSAN